MNRQKFFRGHRVRIAARLPVYMDHFEKDCEAIVIGSYADQYGMRNTKDYSLLLLDKKGKPRYACSWYEERHLTLVNKDRDAGEGILQKYQRRNPDYMS